MQVKRQGLGSRRVKRNVSKNLNSSLHKWMRQRRTRVRESWLVGLAKQKFNFAGIQTPVRGGNVGLSWVSQRKELSWSFEVECVPFLRFLPRFEECPRLPFDSCRSFLFSPGANACWQRSTISVDGNCGAWRVEPGSGSVQERPLRRGDRPFSEGDGTGA